jgi:hypothetical protein
MAKDFLKVRNGVTFKGLSSAPSSPENGDTYYDTTLNKLRTYENGAWQDVISSSSGDVVGPASSTDNALVRYDGTSGKLIQNSSASLSDVGELTLSGSGQNSHLLINKTITTSGSSGIGQGIQVNLEQTSNGTGEFLVGIASSTTLSTNNMDQSTAVYANAINNALNSSELNGVLVDVRNNSTRTVSNLHGINVVPAGNLGTITNYAAIYVSNVATGTVSGYNDALRINAGRAYFGGNLNLNIATASTFAYFDSNKNLVSKTGTETTALLDTFTNSLKGLVPASGGGTTNFLRADGTWVAPTGLATSITAEFTAGENLSLGDAIYISVGAADGGRTAGRAYKLDITNDNRMEFVGLVQANATSGNPVTVQVSGRLSGLSGLVTGEPVYGSSSVVGGRQTSAPNTAGHWVVQLGIAASSTDIIINGAGSAAAAKVTAGSDFNESFTTVTGTATLASSISNVFAYANSSAYTITLPDATANSGKRFTIKKCDTTGNIITLSSSNGIDGGTTRTLVNPYDSITVISDGTQWFIV